MQTKQKHILSTQLNAENNHNSNSGEEQKLFKTKRVIGTPFHILHKDETYYLTLGNNLLTVGMDTEQKVLEHMETHKFDIIGAMIILIIQKEKELTKYDVKEAQTENPSL